MTRKRPSKKDRKNLKATSLIRLENSKTRREGHNPDYDAIHNRNGQLLKAAAYYLLKAMGPDFTNVANVNDIWPFRWALRPEIGLDGDKKEFLIKAASFIASQIDLDAYLETLPANDDMPPERPRLFIPPLPRMPAPELEVPEVPVGWDAHPADELEDDTAIVPGGVRGREPAEAAAQRNAFDRNWWNAVAFNEQIQPAQPPQEQPEIDLGDL